MVRALEWAAFAAVVGLIVAFIAVPQVVAGRWLMWTLQGLFPLAGLPVLRRLVASMHRVREPRFQLANGFIIYLFITGWLLKELREGPAPTGLEIGVVCAVAAVAVVLGVMAVMRAPIAEVEGD